jgi:hypothetical protein
MTPLPSFAVAGLRLGAFVAFTTASCLAAATLTQQIDPPEANVGDPVIVTLTVQGGTIGAIQFPQVDGLEAGGTSFQIKSSDEDGSFTTSVALNISLIPMRPGDFTLPAFDIRTQEGEVLHVKAMKLHVIGSGGNSSTAVTNAAPASSATDSTTNSDAIPATRNGPVVMPSGTNPDATAPQDDGNANANSGPSLSVPRDPDGSPAKVFILITPQTTNAYVGQSVGMEIDFFIRADVAAEQNSLPTIKGSDFLMNSFTTRGRTSLDILENQQYVVETWRTAISAPKSGDFPLGMERDTYWIKSYSASTISSFFGDMIDRRPNLAHEMISSNQLTMHVQPLPDQGRPAHFTGAIGQFQVSGEAQPATVAVGEPVTLRFTVSGEGNFDYVRCPVLPDDPEWKAYVPRSGTNYLEEAHMQAVKTFEQSVIPRKNGNVPLPAASFSYFDPTAKQYITVPIKLPEIVVTGTPPPLVEATPESGGDSVAVTSAPKATDFLPNRLELGSLQGSLVPAYRHAWFWAVETALVSLPLMGALLLFFRARSAPDAGFSERELRKQSIRLEEDAMSAAIRQNDALAFFMAARHAIQLQLGTQWNAQPEAITLGEIRLRDPELAERLAPLFAQADEVIYSGRASIGLDLAEWEQRVRTELLQPQPA